ncbi:hypothetical protein QA648_19375 (plasmid) [Rhizobium sp. CB3171]|uniref:hypothetical protein n=1 Tax=Rhizobium sp. CB3171 TaxID=3039157 RepID=UPI0024B21776|nr:hypothetical protein [Rhizobium sp. CB3171]WFU05357.1 hypothetical protein QA648_19375 [Rhizobium sp. CB3171]
MVSFNRDHQGMSDIADFLVPLTALHTVLDSGRKLLALHFSIFGQHFSWASGA